MTSTDDSPSAVTPDRDEEQKILIKVSKVTEYWQRGSMLIPNVFRLLCEFETASVHLLEFQDLSNKVVLVQGSSHKGTIEDKETRATTTKQPRVRKASSKLRLALKTDSRSKKRGNRPPKLTD